MGVLLTATVAVAAFFGWQRLWPVPEVVVPNDWEQADPQFKAHASSYIWNVRESPREAGRHAELGLVYEANRYWQEAQTCFRNAVALDPDEPRAKHHLAIATQELGDLAGTLVLLRQLGKEHPNFPPGLHDLGNALLENGHGEEAEAAFARVIALAPDKPEGYVGLADAVLQRDDHARAAGLLEQAVRLKPNSGTARHLLGLAYQGLGRQADAEAQLRRGGNAAKQYMPDAWSRQLPKHATGIGRQIRRAMAFVNAGKYAKGAQLLETALQWHPDNIDIMNNLSITYLRDGQLLRAREVLLRAEQTDDTRYETQINLAVCHLRLDRSRDALKYAHRATKLAPKVAKTHDVKAWCLAEERLDERALDAWRTAVGLDPVNPDYRIKLASQLMLLDQCAEAKEQYRTVLEQSSSSVPAHLGVCEASLHLGQVTEATTALNAAQRLAPTNAKVIAMARRLSDMDKR